MPEDRILKCGECNQDFVFTAGEQEFYAQRGFSQDPKRCKNCREQRKSRSRPDSGASPRRSSGPIVENRSFPVEARGGTRAPREMFDAVCATCGTATQVPFRPTAGRPVYCRECYGGGRRGP